MEEINESGAAPEESKVQTGKGGIRQKAKHLARKTAQDWTARDVGTYASSIAFFFFLSMIPLLIIIFQMLPLFGLSEWLFLGAESACPMKRKSPVRRQEIM